MVELVKIDIEGSENEDFIYDELEPEVFGVEVVEMIEIDIGGLKFDDLTVEDLTAEVVEMIEVDLGVLELDDLAVEAVKPVEADFERLKSEEFTAVQLVLEESTIEAVELGELEAEPAKAEDIDGKNREPDENSAKELGLDNPGPRGVELEEDRSAVLILRELIPAKLSVPTELLPPDPEPNRLEFGEPDEVSSADEIDSLIEVAVSLRHATCVQLLLGELETGGHGTIDVILRMLVLVFVIGDDKGFGEGFSICEICEEMRPDVRPWGSVRAGVAADVVEEVCVEVVV